MEELDIQSKPSEEITNMSDILDDLSHKSMAVMENKSIRATTDTETEANNLKSDTCHWRDMLKLCTPLSIRLTHLSNDILKKFIVPKKNVTQKLSGSIKNLVMDSRDYRSRKRKKRNASAKFKYARKKKKTVLDKTSHLSESDESCILKSCTLTSPNDNASAAPACASEEYIRSEKIINKSAMDKVLDGPISMEHTGKVDTTSVQCLNENTQERTQAEKNNTETEESRYQDYVRNILMEYCYSYGNLSHMSKEMNDNENSSDTKSTTGDRRRSNEDCCDDQIPSWNSRKRRKNVQLNSKDETIVNRKSPKKKRQQRSQKNLTLTPTKDDSRRPVFIQRTKSPSCTSPAADQEVVKTGTDSPKKLKIQLMKLENVSGVYTPIESTDMILENERDVFSSMNNDNDSVVGSEGISDAETVVDSVFTEESRNGIETQESDHALDSIPIIALEKKSGSGSEISEVSTERDLEIVEKQRKTSVSSGEIVCLDSESDVYINEVDEAIDIDGILRLRYGIRKNPVVLLEKLNPIHNYVSTNVYQDDHDVSDVFEGSDSTSSDSEIVMFVRKRKSSSVWSRRISSSSEEEHGSSIKSVSMSGSSKDKDDKNRSPISRTTNTREETPEVFVINQTSGISKDTSLEGSEHVATIATQAKKKVSQPENTNNLSPKNIVENPDIIECHSDSSDSDIQVLSVIMNFNIPSETCENIGTNSPSTALSPKKSPSKLCTDNTDSVVMSDTNETPIADTQSPMENTQTPSGSKITPVSTTPRLSCHICNRKYVRKRSLKIHMELQHNNDSTKKFSNPDTTSSTTQECSNTKECLDCGICSKKFVSKKAFVDHVFTHQSEAQQDYRSAPDKRSRSVWLDLYGLKDKNAEDQHVEKSKKDKKDPSSDKRLRKEDQIISSLTTSPKEVVVCPCHPNNGLLNDQDSSVYIEMVLLCEHCNVVFRRKECLETHYRISAQCSVNRTSGRVPKLYCTACHVTVESLSVLRHHLEMHPRLQIRGIVTFLCNICKVIFFGIGSIFRRHWFSHIKNPLFVASRYSFPKISVMKALENYNVSAEERMQVAQAAKLAENIKYVLIAEHVCRHCKLPFGSEADLTNHSTSCSSINNISNVTNALNDGTTCSTCQKTFTDKSNYDIHVGKCHAMADGSSSAKSNDSTSDCKICHMICETEDQLTLHQNIHSSANLLLCCRCGVSFSAVEHFNTHIKATCTICDKQFDCQKRCQDHLSSHFTNLAISERPQESSTKTRTSCDTNLEVDKSTARRNHVENTEVTLSLGSSSLQARRSDAPHQSKSQSEVRYLIIRDEVTKLPKQVVTITPAGNTSNTSCISEEAEQQTRILKEILSITNAPKKVANIVEAQPANIEKNPLASGEEKDTATSTDTEVLTDSSETSSTGGMPCSSKNEKTPKPGFLRVKSMSELLEKRDKKAYICETCGLPCTSAANLAEHSNTHVIHQVANKKTLPLVNIVQRIVDQDTLTLLNQYIASNKLTLQPIRSNITDATPNNFNTEITTNVNNTRANNEGNCGNAAAFTPCVICGTMFNATENPIHCQPTTTSTGQANMHTNAEVYQPVANNKTQSIENASTFNTAVHRSPFVTYTSNAIGREPPVSAVNSVNVNLNMNQQVAPSSNSQCTNLTYNTTNLPSVQSQIPSRLPPPYSAPTNIHSNTLPKNMNGTTTSSINSHCIVPRPPMRPQYPYRAISQSGNKSVAAKPSNSSISSSTSSTNNDMQPITTDAPIGSTRPSGYSMNYDILNVPLQQSQSDIILRTESHVTRKPAHQSISHTIHHLPEQPSQIGSQRPAQLSNFINQPKTTQTYQQTSQQTTREQPCKDLSSGLIFTCPCCKDFTCTTAEEFKLHRTRHTKSQPIQPSKSYCASTSDVELGARSSSYSPVTNQQVRPSSNEPLYVCNKCHTFRTTNHVELQEHMKQHHKSYICQLCHVYKCKSTTLMQEHINLHLDGKIAPHAVRHTLQVDGKIVSKIIAPQLPSSSFSETSHRADVRSSPVHQMQPTQVTNKQYSPCEFRSNGDSQVLDHERSDTLNSCSKNQTVAELQQHQASLHP
ncbi:uncharacterized protein LOC107265405 isoform X2 [Cephus cinctus]|uniref:Uncharacterized protein LOC107265405 isoform X2 n=1 Tax=Cephus cinctus TaxID=211228 RepID=A0AAJ7RCA8_CEPCN|nr:uncharacterized protein LOC107265405 isoform X2 [Cephus cinctus]